MEANIDLLNQALRMLSPHSRGRVNLALAQIQNARNLRHGGFCDIPEADLVYAMTRFAEAEQRNAASDWDNDWNVKGLA